MLSAEQLADITGLADARFDPARGEKRDAERVGVVGRGVMCRLAGGVPAEGLVAVRIRDVSSTGASLLTQLRAARGQVFLVGMERASAIRQAKLTGEATPTLLWVRVEVVHSAVTGGGHTVMGVRFVAFAEAPKKREVVRPVVVAAAPTAGGGSQDGRAVGGAWGGGVVCAVSVWAGAGGAGPSVSAGQ